jgi:hypothetical protein
VIADEVDDEAWASHHFTGDGVGDRPISRSMARSSAGRTSAAPQIGPWTDLKSLVDFDATLKWTRRCPALRGPLRGVDQAVERSCDGGMVQMQCIKRPGVGRYHVGEPFVWTEKPASGESAWPHPRFQLRLAGRARQRAPARALDPPRAALGRWGVGRGGVGTIRPTAFAAAGDT